MSIFHFKQFSIKQSASAMKVGTDAVLLGASTPLSLGESEKDEGIKILDIGAGTGVLSLMLAQKMPKAKITAIEIDKAAAEECLYNFNNSPFTERINCIHSSLRKFLKTPPPTLADVVISNPPFFPGSQAAGSRKKARDSYSLPAEELFEGVGQLLKAEGQFSLIIPYQDEERTVSIASSHRLFPIEILRVRGRKDSKIVRSIIHFKRKEQSLIEKEMYIEKEKRHDYSEEYLRLVRDFLMINMKSESRG